MTAGRNFQISRPNSQKRRGNISKETCNAKQVRGFFIAEKLTNNLV